MSDFINITNIGGDGLTTCLICGGPLDADGNCVRMLEIIVRRDLDDYFGPEADRE